MNWLLEAIPWDHYTCLYNCNFSGNNPLYFITYSQYVKCEGTNWNETNVFRCNYSFLVWMVLGQNGLRYVLRQLAIVYQLYLQQQELVACWVEKNEAVHIANCVVLHETAVAIRFKVSKFETKCYKNWKTVIADTMNKVHDKRKIKNTAYNFSHCMHITVVHIQRYVDVTIHTYIVATLWNFIAQLQLHALCCTPLLFFISDYLLSWISE